MKYVVMFNFILSLKITLCQDTEADLVSSFQSHEYPLYPDLLMHNPFQKRPTFSRTRRYNAQTITDQINDAYVKALLRLTNSLNTIDTTSNNFAQTDDDYDLTKPLYKYFIKDHWVKKPSHNFNSLKPFSENMFRQHLWDPSQAQSSVHRKSFYVPKLDDPKAYPVLYVPVQVDQKDILNSNLIIPLPKAYPFEILNGSTTLFSSEAILSIPPTPSTESGSASPIQPVPSAEPISTAPPISPTKPVSSNNTVPAAATLSPTETLSLTKPVSPTKSVSSMNQDFHSQEHNECDVGSTWNINCYSCMCDSGTANCTKIEDCEFDKSKACKPNTQFLMDACNKCQCDVDGIPVCTLKTCKHVDMEAKKEKTYPEKSEEVIPTTVRRGKKRIYQIIFPRHTKSRTKHTKYS